MPDPFDNLLGPDNQPLLKEPRLIVVKFPKNAPVKPELLAMIGKHTNCNVISVPMTCEIMMGRLAAEELVSVHTATHAIFQIPFMHFTQPELTAISASLKYTVDKTGAAPDSIESTLSEQLIKSLNPTS